MGESAWEGSGVAVFRKETTDCGGRTSLTTGLHPRKNSVPSTGCGASIGAGFLIQRTNQCVPMNRDAREHRAEILQLAREHGAYNVRLFGSVARGDDQPDSDLDLLVDMEPGRSLLDHIALQQDLEDLLGREVDVVTESSLHPRLRDRVLREAVALQ